MLKKILREFALLFENECRLSIIIFSLYSSWMLAMPFEGQVLYALAEQNDFDAHGIIFWAIAAHFIGLVTCGFFIKRIEDAKNFMTVSILICMIATCFFFFTPSVLWSALLLIMSFLAGMSIASWACYFKRGTSEYNRTGTIASALILSNILMILLNIVALNISPYAGLGTSIAFLSIAFLFASKLKLQKEEPPVKDTHKAISLQKPLLVLCLFIVIITINSGLMYQVIKPAFEHHSLLVSWYWALPYIGALYLMKKLPMRFNRTYIFYFAIAMLGVSFILFMVFDRSAISYIIVDTLMLGALGIFDIFWWSTLGEMLDFHENPSRILGIGLSANVLGVLLGGILGNTVLTRFTEFENIPMVALVVIFITIIILPLLHKELSLLLRSHVSLITFYEMTPVEQKESIDNIHKTIQLTKRENEIVALLLKGRTYKMIADELYVSENTIKTHIKNIYSKFNVKSKRELIYLFLEEKTGTD